MYARERALDTRTRTTRPEKPPRQSRLWHAYAHTRTHWDFRSLIGAMQCAAVRAEGVYTVYYQTEPLPAGECLLPPYRKPAPVLARTSAAAAAPVLLMDELWDYSQWNLLQCYRHPHAPILRHVPPGYSPPMEATRPLQRQAEKGIAPADSRALFLGDVSLEERAACFAPLAKVARPLNDVWSDDALNRLVRASSRPPLLLNVHKRCSRDEREQPLEAVRLAQLLSVGGVLVSQRADVLDEATYDGLVTFTSLCDVPSVIATLMQTPAEELRALADKRSAAFRERFRPERVIARALARRWLPSPEDLARVPDAPPVSKPARLRSRTTGSTRLCTQDRT